MYCCIYYILFTLIKKRLCVIIFLGGEAMNAQKIVFFDIDHTIYDPIKKEIPKSTRAAIQQLSMREDVFVAVATGRAHYMLDIIDPIKPYIDIYITINGQVITYGKKTLHDAHLDQTTIREVKAIFNKHHLIYGSIGNQTQAVNRLNEAAIAEFHQASMPLPRIDPDFDKQYKVYQMWAFSDDKTFKKVSLDLPEYQVVPWLSDGFDVVLKNHSKRDGIKKVLAHFNIKLEHAYAFGDGENDIEMLSYIPNSYAMGNAKQHVKKSAKEVAPRYDEDGIYKALVAAKLIKENDAYDR